jgi:putative cardiolipin synthase
VPEVSRQFDLYWNSPSAYPSAGFTGPAEADGTAGLLAKFGAARASAASVAFVESLRSAPFVRELLERRVGMEWVHARLVHDDPAKTLDTKGRTDILLFPELIKAIGRPQASFDLVSPYFVPGDQGTAALAALAGGGTRVRVVTNSLASSESAVVFSGYSKRRHELLRAGVRLFELKPVVSREAREGKAALGTSSSTALHAKTFAVDGERAFVGSFNFDLRSARLNTEMGLVLESPLLATRLARVFDDVVPLAAYEVRLRAGGEGLEWIERTATGEVRHETEPGIGLLRRLGTGLLETLAIDWML